MIITYNPGQCLILSPSQGRVESGPDIYGQARSGMNAGSENSALGGTDRLAGGATGDSAGADGSLMLAYARGDSASFEILYQKYRPMLFRFFVLAVSDEGVANELYQETWVKVIRARESYQPSAAFSTWLFTISRNCLRDYYRKRHPEFVEFDTVDENLDSNSENRLEAGAIETDELRPDEMAMLKQQSESLSQAIEMLPLNQKEAILLRYVAGMTIAEIAESVDEKLETIKSRLRYAVPKLKANLRQSLEDKQRFA